MNVLIVCRKKNENISPFVVDQVNDLINEGLNVSYFFITKKGILGYLYHYKPFLNFIRSKKPDLIHAHYGFCGLFSCLQNICPTIVTFHGSDINLFKSRIFSFFAHAMSSESIFVSKKLSNKLLSRNAVIIPCGIDLTNFKQLDVIQCREQFNLDKKKYILFSSSFDNKIKNFPLAKKAIDLLYNIDVEIIELKGFNRDQVAQLLNAVDLLLMTSSSEGSPQVIKEAMACGCPIVSTDVGDVKWIFGDIAGCYICSHDPRDIAKKIDMAIKFKDLESHTKGRDRIIELGFDKKSIVRKIIKIYRKVLS